MRNCTIVGTFNSHEGYGHATLATVKALWRLGARPMVYPVQHNDLMWRAEDAVTVEGSLALAWTVPEYWDRVGADELWGAFVWETTQLPRYRVDMINERVTRLFTFSDWAKGMFEDSGVTIPITVMPHGVDQREYHYLERDHEGQPYTFLILGELAERKGWIPTYLAFLEEFGEDPNVRLIMKTRGRSSLAPCTDENVEVIYEDYGLGEMRELYCMADCFLFPSSGEGYGMPPREAAATGLPVITTNWSGLTDGIEHYAYPLRYTMVRANYGYQDIEECGDWAKPDSEHLRQLMRWCFENRDEAAEKGRRAAEWIRENCRWETGAQALLNEVACYFERP